MCCFNKVHLSPILLVQKRKMTDVISRPYKAQHKPHFTAQQTIQTAFCEQQSQQSCTVHRHGEQVHV